MKTCRNCYAQNQDDAVLCTDCGMSLRRAAIGEEAVRLGELGRRLQAEEREATRKQLQEPATGETPSGQSRLAYRLAAALLFVNVLLNIVDGLLGGGPYLAAKVIPVVAGLIIAIGVYQLRGGFRLWALVGAALGAVAIPILCFLTNDPFTAGFMSVMQWGLCAAIILLLTGQSRTWRVALAVGIYMLFVLIPTELGLLAIALAWFLGVEV